MALKPKITKQAVVTPDPVPEEKAVYQAPAELEAPGFDPERMRKCCTKCGSIQLITESIVKKLAVDGVSLGERNVTLRCNDCGTKFKG